MMSRSALTKVHAVILIVVAICAIGVAAYSYTALTAPTATTTMTPMTQLIVSTTTSLYETGLLDALQKDFEAKNPSMNVSFIAQGTGLAIQTAMRGDADMILVHAPSSEYVFLNGSYGVNRKIFAYNFFTIVGPASDPAHIHGLGAKEALQAIMSAGKNGTALWVSRGDNSGTYTKEVSLWKSINVTVSQLRSQSWYIEAGSGMTATLQLANEKQAYTLSDVGTYLVNYNNHNINLVRLVVESKSLLNVYSAIADNPLNANMTKSNFAGAMQFIRYLVSNSTQQLIANYGLSQYGQPLFYPYVPLATSQSNQTLLSWIHAYAFFQGSECPTQFRYQASDLYSASDTIQPMIFMAVLTWILERKLPLWIQSFKA